MAYEEQHNQDTNDQAYEPLAQGGKKAGGKLAKKGAAVLSKALKKALMATVKIIIAHLGVVIGFLFIAFIAFQIDLNFQGTSQQYSKDHENDVVVNEEGTPIATEESMNAENKAVRDFYKYHSGISYYQIVGNDNTKLIDPDGEDAVQDYYRSADIFKLKSNLLFALDEYLYERRFRYPEQFIKPVNYDPATLKLKPLVDEKGLVSAVSKEIDLETGKETGKEIKSVRDYGLASIVKFNNTQDWYKTVTFKGKYIKKDVWDPNKKKVVQKTVNESFNIAVAGYPQKIYLVEKVISFAGEVEYNYEYKETQVSEITPGISQSTYDPKDKVKYATHTETTSYYKKNPDGTTAMDRYGMPIKITYTTDYPLYKYRSSDSGMYEKLPVETSVVTTENDIGYLKSYIDNFESYIPSDVISDFDFTDRIDYESVGFDAEATLVEDYQLPLGSATDSSKFNNSLAYLPIIKKHAAEFGVDPFVLLAVITQESGGVATINKNGLMQITSNSYSISQTAKDANGVIQTVTVTLPERQNPDKSIRYGAAYIKRLMDMFDGNVYKALQAYNLGEGTMNYIKNNYPAAWNTQYGWLLYREAARMNSGGPNTRSASYKCMAFPSGVKTTGSYWGDSCYLENVLRYYAGHQLEKIETQGSSWNFLVSATDLISKFLPSGKKDIPHVEFAEDVNPGTTELILRSVAAYEQRGYFTEMDDYEELSFWDEGFMQSLGTIGMSMGDLVGMSGAYGEYLPPIIIGNGIRVSSQFGNRFHPIYKEYRLHKGIDVAAPTGTPLYAVADGVIEIAKFGRGYGNYVKVKHTDGTAAMYLHMDRYIVKAGDIVKAGQVLGTVGNTGDSTGPHLHFEFHVNGVPVDPLSLVERSISLRALEVALTKEGSPYVWGASGPNAFDCSGLVLWAYQQVGYKKMPRTTREQYLAGEPVTRANAQPGDLIYFKNGTSSAAVDHVGIYLGNDMMFHAPNPSTPVGKRSVYWNKMVTIRRHK